MEQPTNEVPPSYEEAQQIPHQDKRVLNAQQQMGTSVTTDIPYTAYGVSDGLPLVDNDVLSHPHSQQSITVTQHTLAPVIVVMGKQPVELTCNFCGHHVITNTQSDLRSDAYMWACILCFLGGLLCCWIPFVLDSSYTTRHSCPNCGAHVGAHNA